MIESVTTESPSAKIIEGLMHLSFCFSKTREETDVLLPCQ